MQGPTESQRKAQAVSMRITTMLFVDLTHSILRSARGNDRAQSVARLLETGGVCDLRHINQYISLALPGQMTREDSHLCKIVRFTQMPVTATPLARCC